MNDIYDTIIIGSGIAGITSAIYLKRYNLNCLIIEKQIPGGQISKSSNIENYPGIKQIDGATFSSNLLEQITNLNIPLLYEDVIKIEDKKEYKIIKTNNNEYKAKTVIIASGRSPKKLNIETEEELIGKGISYCATCDGMFYKNKEVVVVGGGNSALEEAIYLSKICKNVTILNRSDNIRADKIFVQKIKDISNINILLNSEIKKIKTNNDKIESIILKNDKIINCEGIFIYVGLNPNINFISNIKTKNDYILVNEKYETNIKGIYAVGDVIKKDLYQLITSSAEGALVANDIINNRES
jgi:thioredoxin reductase (NADPH)